MSSKRRGSQEPRIRVLPKRDDWGELYSDGDDACELSSAYGLTPDLWQRLVIIDWLKRDDSDKYAATSCGLALPRQNGKNAVIEMRELYGLVACGEKILHTAHRVDTARKAFLRLASFFENDSYPELKEMVVSIRRTNGQEAIVLNNGASIEFSSRVNGGARGSTYDVVVFDEAQELTNDQMEAILKALGTDGGSHHSLVVLDKVDLVAGLVGLFRVELLVACILEHLLALGGDLTLGLACIQELLVALGKVVGLLLHVSVLIGDVSRLIEQLFSQLLVRSFFCHRISPAFLFRYS